VIWIWQPSDLKARYYMEYSDSSKMINFAHSTIVRDNNKMVTERTDYYKSKAPRELEEMIYRFLLNKKFSQSYKDSIEPKRLVHYDTDWYCIIYKFENQPEKIITYRPHTITDSLKTFVEQLESYKKLNSFEPQKPFDIEYFIEKYKKIIVEGIPLAPPPCPDSTEQAKVKYTGTNKKNK